MRRCPHCDTPVPPGVSRCPRCGRIYWEPGSNPSFEEKQNSSGEPERKGCAALIICPLLISAAVTSALLLFGFGTQLIGRWKDYSFSVFWILISILLGAVVFRWLFKKKDRDSEEDS